MKTNKHYMVTLEITRQNEIKHSTHLISANSEKAAYRYAVMRDSSDVDTIEKTNDVHYTDNNGENRYELHSIKPVKDGHVEILTQYL